MWKSAYVGVYQLLNWKMHGETLKFYFAFFKVRCTLAMLICLMSNVFGFFDDHENCCNTIAEKAGLTDVSGLLDCCLCKACTKPSASNWSWKHLTVTCVGGSVANSRNSCLRLHTHSHIFSTTSKLPCIALR